MAFDPQKYNLHRIMDPAMVEIKYPDELKSDTWRKEKGKLCPETGIGKLLDKCEQAYKGVAWETFNARTLKTLDAEYERVEKWFKGPQIKKYADACQDVADLAKKKAAELKKAKLVPKAAGEAAEAVFKAADWLTVTLNKESMRGYALEAQTACKKKLLDNAMRTAGQNIPSAKDVRDKIPKVLKSIQDDLNLWGDNNGDTQLAAVGGALRNLCRDITQPIGNLLKAQIAGASFQNFDQDKLGALYKEMVVISNTQGWSNSYGGFDKKKMQVEYDKVADWTKRYSLLTAPIALPN